MVGWPWLASSCPPSCSITPLLNGTRGENTSNNLWVEVRTEKSLSNYHHKWNRLSLGKLISFCPGFKRDRVNFHQNLGRGTAGWADPTWPNRAGYSVPCAFMLGSRWGGAEQRELTQEHAAAVRSGRAALWVVRIVLCILLICIIIVTVPFVCCSVKLPLSRPTCFCLFLSILLCTAAGGGAATWRFCCWPQPNHNTFIAV